MKRYATVVTAVLLLLSLLNFSACMDVTVDVDGINTGNLDALGGNNNNIPDVPQMDVIPDVQETTTAPVVTLPPVETTAPAENETTTRPSATVKTPLEMSDAELLEYFNNNLNGIKEEKPGFKRAKLTTVSDIVLSNQAANALVGFVKGALLSEETEEKTASKGSSCNEIMSPDGQRYVSQLNAEDIKDIDIRVEGTNYVVTVTLPDAKNPTKDAGFYAKIFNFITVDDVVNTYAPKVGATVDRKNIEVNYSGCYAKATFSPDGKVVAYDTYVTCVISLKDASIKKVVTINTDVDITLVSTTNYTNFIY